MCAPDSSGAHASFIRDLMKLKCIAASSALLGVFFLLQGCSGGPSDDKDMRAGLKSQGGQFDINKVPAAQRGMVQGIMDAGKKAHAGTPPATAPGPGGIG